jgi:hypothetical protein
LLYPETQALESTRPTGNGDLRGFHKTTGTLVSLWAGMNLQNPASATDFSALKSGVLAFETTPFFLQLIVVPGLWEGCIKATTASKDRAFFSRATGCPGFGVPGERFLLAGAKGQVLVREDGDLDFSSWKTTFLRPAVVSACFYGGSKSLQPREKQTPKRWALLTRGKTPI